MRRRAIFLITAMAVAMLLAGGVALAKNISCARQDSRVCKGTNNNDLITGTNRGETIKARGGDDQVMARGGKDKVFGQDGADLLMGGPGNDTLDGGSSPSGSSNPEFLAGEAGDDTLVESPGPDRYGFGPEWGQDQITGDGDQPDLQPDSDGLCFACGLGVITTPLTINLALGTATDGTNKVTWDTTGEPFIEDATGGSGADSITGSTRRNIIDGHLGNDTINVADGNGGDIVNCGGGTDTVIMDAEDRAANDCEL